MSNLYKQQFVINLANQKRVINADDRFKNPATSVQAGNTAEPLVPGSEEILDGFLAGLEAEEVVPEPQITPDELLEQARMEADAIVAAARAEAISITDNAQREAELLLAQSKAAGYNEGVAQMKQDLEQEQERMRLEYAAQKNQLQQEHDTKLEAMEADIVDAVIAVFNRVFGIQFEDKREILLHLVNNTLMNEEVGKSFHIRVASDNLKFMESRIGDIKEKIGNDINVEIVNDMNLGPEDCIIETESGVFNCSIDMELINLEKDIRSLCG